MEVYANDNPDAAAKKISEEGKWFVVPENGKGKDKKKKYSLLKHSEKGLLAEVVIIGRKPYFAISRIKDNKVRVTLEESIDNEIETIIPSPNPMSRTFDFKSEEDFYSYVRRAKNETLDSLYKKVKSIWKKYIDADDFHISLCAADTIFTYFQDKIGLTHYLFFVGGGDTGKSNNLTVFEYVGYRCFNSLGITAANIYTSLGNGEEGQGIICEDEADNIDWDRDKMKYYKSGYQSGKKVARTDLPQGERTQNKWNTFSFKAFAAERLPDIVKAKGFHQRIIVLYCEDGFPEYDIAEVVSAEGEEEFQELLDELNDTHSLLLAYRLLHFHDVIPNIKLNIRNREKQLFKPVLRVFQNTNTIKELLPVVSSYINLRREKNANSLEAYVYQIVDELIKARNSYAIESSAIWTKLKDSLSGEDIARKPLSYDTALFGVISQKQITGILEEQFKAKRSAHKGSSAKLVFNSERLKSLDRKYKLVSVRVVTNNENENENEHGSGVVGVVGEDPRGVGLDRHVNEDSKLSESEHKNDNISINDGPNDVKTIEGNGEKGPTHPYKPPQTTPSTPNPDIYRLGHSDKFACHNCKRRGDVHEMRVHECNGKKKP